MDKSRTLHRCIVSWLIRLIAVDCASGLPVHNADGNDFTNEFGKEFQFGDGLQQGTLVALFLSVALVISLVFVVLVCLCCKFTSSASWQNISIPVPFQEIEQSNTVPQTSRAEFTIFPPAASGNLLIDSGENSEDVRFEPLPDLKPRRLATQTTFQKPRPATFRNALSNGLSCSDWFEDPYSNFPRPQLQYVRELGSGWFGEVVEGEAYGIVSMQKKTRVVVKILMEVTNSTDQMYFLNEVKLFRDSMHPNVLKLLGKCLESDPFLIILEDCALRDLKSYLIKQRSMAEVLLQGNNLLNMACNVATGLQYLHERGFILTDLAARNCLVGEDGTVKIGDYGNSIEMFKDDYYCAGGIAVPVRWCAPETIGCTSTIMETMELTPEANVWSYGVVLWEILEFCKLPYMELSDDEFIQRVIMEQTEKLKKPLMPCPHIHRLYQIIQLCHLTPKCRPNMGTICSMLSHLLTYTGTSGNANSEFESRWNALQPQRTSIKTNLVEVHNGDLSSSPEQSLSCCSDSEVRMMSPILQNPSDSFNGLGLESDSFTMGELHTRDMEAMNVNFNKDDPSSLVATITTSIDTQNLTTPSQQSNEKEVSPFTREVEEVIRQLDENLERECPLSMSSENTKTESDLQSLYEETESEYSLLSDNHCSEADVDSMAAIFSSANPSSMAMNLCVDGCYAGTAGFRVPYSDEDDTSWKNMVESSNQESHEITRMIREKSHSAQDFLKLTVIDNESGSDSDVAQGSLPKESVENPQVCSETTNTGSPVDSFEHFSSDDSMMLSNGGDRPTCVNQVRSPICTFIDPPNTVCFTNLSSMENIGSLPPNASCKMFSFLDKYASELIFYVAKKAITMAAQMCAPKSFQSLSDKLKCDIGCSASSIVPQMPISCMELITVNKAADIHIEEDTIPQVKIVTGPPHCDLNFSFNCKSPNLGYNEDLPNHPSKPYTLQECDQQSILFESSHFLNWGINGQQLILTPFSTYFGHCQPPYVKLCVQPSPFLQGLFNNKQNEESISVFRCEASWLLPTISATLPSFSYIPRSFKVCFVTSLESWNTVFNGESSSGGYIVNDQDNSIHEKLNKDGWETITFNTSTCKVEDMCLSLRTASDLITSYARNVDSPYVKYLFCENNIRACSCKSPSCHNPGSDGLSSKCVSLRTINLKDRLLCQTSSVNIKLCVHCGILSFQRNNTEKSSCSADEGFDAYKIEMSASPVIYFPEEEEALLVALKRNRSILLDSLQQKSKLSFLQVTCDALKRETQLQEICQKYDPQIVSGSLKLWSKENRVLRNSHNRINWSVDSISNGRAASITDLATSFHHLSSIHGYTGRKSLQNFVDNFVLCKGAEMRVINQWTTRPMELDILPLQNMSRSHLSIIKTLEESAQSLKDNDVQSQIISLKSQYENRFEVHVIPKDPLERLAYVSPSIQLVSPKQISNLPITNSIGANAKLMLHSVSLLQPGAVMDSVAGTIPPGLTETKVEKMELCKEPLVLLDLNGKEKDAEASLPAWGSIWESSLPSSRLCSSHCSSTSGEFNSLKHVESNIFTTGNYQEKCDAMWQNKEDEVADDEMDEDEDDDDDDDDEDGEDEDGDDEEPQLFQISVWNKDLAPMKSVIRSHHQRISPEARKTVSFQLSSRSVIYEYPRAEVENRIEDGDDCALWNFQVYNPELDYSKYADWELANEEMPEEFDESSESSTDFPSLSRQKYAYTTGTSVQSQHLYKLSNIGDEDLQSLSSSCNSDNYSQPDPFDFATYFAHYNSGGMPYMNAESTSSVTQQPDDFWLETILNTGDFFVNGSDGPFEFSVDSLDQAALPQWSLLPVGMSVYSGVLPSEEHWEVQQNHSDQNDEQQYLDYNVYDNLAETDNKGKKNEMDEDNDLRPISLVVTDSLSQQRKDHNLSGLMNIKPTSVLGPTPESENRNWDKIFNGDGTEESIAVGAYSSEEICSEHFSKDGSLHISSGDLLMLDNPQIEQQQKQMFATDGRMSSEDLESENANCVTGVNNLDRDWKTNGDGNCGIDTGMKS